MNRTNALHEIIHFGANSEFAYRILASLPFDSETEVIIVNLAILKLVLNKFLTKEITADELEQWANFIECREDLNYAEIEDYIYALANPALMGELNATKISKMMSLLADV